MTIVFEHSSKKTQQSIFGLKRFFFFFFFFWMKFYSFINSRVLIKNLITVFIKLQPKNTQIRHFCSQIQAFSFFHEISHFDKFEGAGFKYDTSFLKFQPKNTKIRHLWSQIQIFSFFHEILQLGKFKGADFKYDSIVFSPEIPK